MLKDVGIVVPKITQEPHTSIGFYMHASNPSAWGMLVYRELTSRVIWINSRGEGTASFRGSQWCLSSKMVFL